VAILDTQNQSHPTGLHSETQHQISSNSVQQF